MKDKLLVVKIGGSIIENDLILNDFLKSFSKIKSKKILVHGGGKIASSFLKKIGVVPKLVDGRRITDKKTLDIVTMTYAGLLNKKIVTNLQKYNCNSLGLSGSDGNLILAKKRGVKKIDYGYVGDIKKINTNLLDEIINMKICPIICSLSHDKKGQILNTNADSIASEISIKLSKKYDVILKYCFDKPGLLINNTLINSINTNDYKNLIEKNIIKDGMIPKIDNCFYALKNGVNEIFIGNHNIIKNIKNCTTLTL